MKSAIAIFLFSVGVTGLVAGETPPDLTEAEKKLFSANYLVPSPSELFRALDNLNKRRWDEIAQFIKDDESKLRRDYKGNLTLAMNLGIRVADGFLGVAAKDKTLIENMGPVIKTIAQRLGVQESLIGVGDKIKQYAQEDNWEELTRELDSLQNGILTEMIRLRDNDAALLGSIAGWLEGLHLVTKSLSTSYDEASTEILRQPWIVDHFLADLANSDESLKRKPLVVEITKGLIKIKPLCEVRPNESVPEKNVKTLHEISASLVSMIQRSET